VPRQSPCSRGEPDIDILSAENNFVQVKINGVDVFHPNTGEVRSDGADGIACWFIDTDYNGESFFVRHAYFWARTIRTNHSKRR
jgi:adenine-specific DNA-methyltransferase